MTSAASYELEAGVPIPPARRTGDGGAGPGLKYPWPDMLVRESFSVEVARWEKPRTVSNRLRAAARGWAIRNAPDKAFTVRIVDGGVRVWRTR